jgi:large subunit ribosomal protein L23
MAKAKAKEKTEKKNPAAAEWMYEIIGRPHVTEKATLGSAHGQITFQVPLWATKPQVRQAIEVLFGVKVIGVNTAIMKGKTKRFKGAKGFRSDMKKAIVTLAEGQTIDVGTGV